MEPRGFLASLFDLSFTSYVTTKIIRLLYVLAIIGVCLGALAVLVSGFTSDGASGVLRGLIGAPIVLVVGLILARVYTELLMVLFVIAENTTAIRQRLEAGGAATASSAPTTPGAWPGPAGSQ